MWAAQVVQRNWRGYASRRWFELLRRQQAACGHMQRVWRGALVRRRVKAMRRRRDHAAALIQVKEAAGMSLAPLFAVFVRFERLLTYSPRAVYAGAAYVDGGGDRGAVGAGRWFY